MTAIEYLSMSKPKRIAFKFLNFFKNIPIAIWNFLRKIPYKCGLIFEKIKVPFIILWDALVYGDWKTKLSFVIFGFGQLFHKEKIKGILMFIYEVFFIVYMIVTGAPNLALLGNLGYIASVSYPNPDFGNITTTQYYNNSFQIILTSIVTIVFILIFAGLFYCSARRAKELQDLANVGKGTTDIQFLKDLGEKDFHKTLLAIPMVGLVCFTIIPIIFMILIAFTNYNTYHTFPARLFDWVGFQNFANIFSATDVGNNLFLTTFLQVLLWTLIWAFFATFTNYFLGMIVAILINTKGIKLKKLWRTILVTTIAVPQFVSLLLINRMLNQDMGIVNQWLLQLGWIEKGIPWLNDAVISKVVIIIVNTWIGIPYTMLICTGLLMNIPEDLYESAKIDGASPYKMYMKITLPYMLFVTMPYLISQFVGNINNFNVIYLLSQGNPVFTFEPGLTVPQNLNGVGQTDLLITWIYKLTMTNAYKDYGTASVLGIMIFIVVAFFSVIFYSKSNSVQNEEDFQ